VCSSDLENLSAGEIGKRLVLDSATLSGVLDRMAEAKWIIKNTAYEDRRLLQISLTEKAKKMKDELLSENEKLNNEVMGKFRLEEQLLLERILTDMR